ncbi:MAG: DUF1768 domain-containing protein [Candidatus Moeniiplasma glomeromycotorum]|nr:DUF1768 domain-containing protein [Candidatus Moeniiplasma glomeromycotorum]
MNLTNRTDMDNKNKYPGQPDNQIWFYDKNYNYYGFTNFWPAPFTISEIPPGLGLSPELVGSWKTSEHLFQAAKFTDKEIIEKIRSAPNTGFRQPGGVFNLANSGQGEYKNEIRKDWHGVKVKVMRWVVKQKFSQNSDLKNLLWKTGNKELVENSLEKDNFWGNGKDRNGENWLGKILMEIRQEIIAELGEYKPSSEKPKAPETTSPLTCASCSKVINVFGGESVYFYGGGENNKFCSPECLNKQKEKNKGNSNSTPDNEKSGDQISQAQTKAFTEISATLEQDPKITDSELDYHQNWREILKKFTDLNKIEIFKNDVIAHIKTKRKTKLEAEKAKNEVKNAQNKSGEELRQDLKNLKKKESDKSHQEQQEDIEKLSKKSAQEDPNSYRKMAVDLIKENLKNNQIEESELEKLPEIKNDWKKINEEQTNQPEEIINAEKKINKKVNQIGAQKRFDKVLETANQALKLGEKKQLKKALEEIIKFVSSSNLYDQAIYSQLQQQKALKELKSKLENYSVNNSNLPPKSPLWKKVVPVSLLVILGGVIMITMIKIINIRKGRQKKKS